MFSQTCNASHQQDVKHELTQTRSRSTKSCTLKAAGANPTCQGLVCIVYHFPAMLWRLFYPDLAQNQLGATIKTTVRRRGSFALATTPERWSVPSHGSDLLRSGDDTCGFWWCRDRPGLHVLKYHGKPVVWDRHGNQDPLVAGLSAAGCLESHGQENDPR